MEHRPPLLDHDALADSIIEKSTVYHFYAKERLDGGGDAGVRELGRFGDASSEGANSPVILLLESCAFPRAKPVGRW